MLNSDTNNAKDLRIYQIIDANLDRAREGLRVIEDWARFGLGEEKYVKKIKNFRQILGENHLEFINNLEIILRINAKDWPIKSNSTEKLLRKL